MRDPSVICNCRGGSFSLRLWKANPCIRLPAFLALIWIIFGTASVYGTTTTLVGKGAAWKYRDNGTNQGTVWRGSPFDDSGWTSGTAQLGYGAVSYTHLTLPTKRIV